MSWAVLAAAAIAGCTALSQPNFGYLIESSFNNSEARLHELYTIKALPLAVARQDFPRAPTLAAIEQTNPTTEGGQLLRDAAITDSTVEGALESNGLPEAVEINRSLAPVDAQWFAMYYPNPPHTVVYETTIVEFDPVGSRYSGREVFRMNAVPRSAYRFALGVGATPPPWPVTIPAGVREDFGVGELGTPPPPNVDGQPWAQMAGSIASQMRQGRADYGRRAYQALTRLKRANPVAGLEWKAVLFDSAVASGFGVPDGTLFISTTLVEQLSDDQLAAAMAHLMGHERYQQYPQNLRVGEQVRLVGSTKFLPEVPKYPDVLALPDYGYSRWQEVDANRIAIEYLAKIDIPPDTLFDALHKLSVESPEPGAEEWPSFARIHHLPQTAADLARMLDAGIFHSPDGVAELSR